ncbi:MAG: Bax inhibitor-1 family protein [Verrucomicrobiota bacterium]
MDQYTNVAPAVGMADVDTRARFIMRTYNHLFGAILAFTGIEIMLFKTGLAETIAAAMLGTSWLLVLGAFMVVSWLATRISLTARSLGAQYAALGGFIIAEALIFVPILYIAEQHAGGNVISSAATVTFIGFAVLTGVAWYTRKDFSFMRGILTWGGIIALVAIVGAVIFKFELGIWFSLAMIALAGAAILYDTSNILHHYPEDRYVGAALSLFASVALMFWYVLRLFMSRR